jgi:hypothetical protein
MLRLWAMACLSVGMLLGLAFGQEKAPAKPTTFRPIPHTLTTVVKVDAAANTITLKGTYRGKEQEWTLKVVSDSKVMKDGKDAKLTDFKEGEQVLVSWKPGMKEIRALADPVTFFAFLRYPTVKGKVKAFDAAALTLTVEAEGKEQKFTMPGRGVCCFVGGKGHRSKEGALKGGEEVVVVLRTPDSARAVFDAASWKVYGEQEWQAYQKRAGAKKGA